MEQTRDTGIIEGPGATWIFNFRHDLWTWVPISEDIGDKTKLGSPVGTCSDFW